MTGLRVIADTANRCARHPALRDWHICGQVTGTGRLQHGDDVAQRLRRLRRKVVGRGYARRVPAHLPSDIDLLAARGQPSGRIASFMSLFPSSPVVPSTTRGR